MVGRLSPADVQMLGALVTDGLGLKLEARAEPLAAALAERCAARACRSARAYARVLKEPAAGRAELRALAERLTVGETCFFRNRPQFDAFARHVAPALGRPLRVLSAGCSSGEEPYSVALALRALAPRDLTTHAVDVNPAAIARAVDARYGARAVRHVPPALRESAFAREGARYALAPDVRRLVVLEEGNLLDDDLLAWQRGPYDAVFFRNVMLYLTPAAVQRIIARLESVLAPGGALFLGEAETLLGVEHGLELCEAESTFFFRARLQASWVQDVGRTAAEIVARLRRARER